MILRELVEQLQAEVDAGRGELPVYCETPRMVPLLHPVSMRATREGFFIYY